MTDDAHLPTRVGVIEARLAHLDDDVRQLWVDTRALDKSVQALDRSLQGLDNLRAALDGVTRSLDQVQDGLGAVQAQQQQWRGERRAAGWLFGMGGTVIGAILAKGFDWLSSGGGH